MAAALAAVVAAGQVVLVEVVQVKQVMVAQELNPGEAHKVPAVLAQVQAVQYRALL